MSNPQISINISSTEPIFEQLVSQIKNAISVGHLLGGESLPSIRQLATDLGVNAKTVAKAYRLLERDEVIVSRGYRGSFVHENAKSNLQTDIKSWLEDQLAIDIKRYRDSGATDSEIRIAFSNAMHGKS